MIHEADVLAETRPELFRELFEHANDAILIADAATGKLIEVNERATELFGYTREEMKGMHQSQLHPAERREEYRKVFEDHVSAESAVFDHLEIVDREGTVIPVDISANLLPTEERPLFVGIFRDMRTQRELERKLRTQTSLYETLLAEAPAAVLLCEPEGEIVTANQRASDLSGYDRTQLEQQKVVHELFAEPAQCEVLVERIHAADHIEEVDGRIERSDGSAVPCLVSGSRIRTEASDLVMLVLQDVTDQKAAEQTLRSAKERAEKASRVKSAMLANMSHEIRTPLSTIIGFAETVQAEVQGREANLLELIQKSGERLLSTLTGILELARLEAGDRTLSPKEIDLVGRIESTCALYRASAEEKGLRFEVTVPDTTPEVILDPSVLESILQNLLSNAVKFTEEGQIRLTVRMEEMLTIRVEDTGVGMSDAFLDDVFGALIAQYRGDFGRGGTAIRREEFPFGTGQDFVRVFEEVRIRIRPGNHFLFLRIDGDQDTLHLPQIGEGRLEAVVGK